MPNWTPPHHEARTAEEVEAGGLLSAASLTKLHEAYPGQDYTYGGWIKTTTAWAEGPVLSHDGSNNYNYTSLWVVPQQKAVLFSVANAGGGKAHEAAQATIARLAAIHKP